MVEGGRRPLPVAAVYADKERDVKLDRSASTVEVSNSRSGEGSSSLLDDPWRTARRSGWISTHGASGLVARGG